MSENPRALGYPCITAILRRYHINQRLPLLSRIPDLRKIEEKAGYEFADVNIEKYVEGAQRALQLRLDFTEMSVHESGGSVVVEYLMRNYRTPKTFDEVVDTWITYFLARPKTTVAFMRFKDHFPTVPLESVAKIGNLQMEVSICKPPPEFLNLLTEKRIPISKTTIETGDPEVMNIAWLRGLTMEELRIDAGLLTNFQTLNEFNVQMLHISENASNVEAEGVELIDRILVFARLFLDLPHLHPRSAYQLRVTEAVQQNIVSNAMMKEKLLEMGGRVSNDGDRFCVTLGADKPVTVKESTVGQRVPAVVVSPVARNRRNVRN